ncbi:hypothetical protein BAE44_0017281, partial [Dichanthelium oligosanthes]
LAPWTRRRRRARSRSARARRPRRTPAAAAAARRGAERRTASPCLGGSSTPSARSHAPRRP